MAAQLTSSCRSESASLGSAKARRWAAQRSPDLRHAFFECVEALAAARVVRLVEGIASSLKEGGRYLVSRCLLSAAAAIGLPGAKTRRRVRIWDSPCKRQITTIRAV